MILHNINTDILKRVKAAAITEIIHFLPMFDCICFIFFRIISITLLLLVPQLSTIATIGDTTLGNTKKARSLVPSAVNILLIFYKKVPARTVSKYYALSVVMTVYIMQTIHVHFNFDSMFLTLD